MGGNLIDLAIAFMLGASFGEVVKAFTKIILDIIGLIAGNPNFDTVAIGQVNVGVHHSCGVVRDLGRRALCRCGQALRADPSARQEAVGGSSCGSHDRGPPRRDLRPAQNAESWSIAIG
ncbi:MAG TPA: MscL family protein, partial [Propionicimonas sp.]